ncbi:hypothetical protein [Aquimarina longa]|uniref:hypothetical protein n=1 Tax=Aquimarina longa TaxID=1080221 RepID=UPI000A6D12FF|nr:hypothetical protein [Aquimarina longa]
MKKDVDISDVKLIIRNLISFIVVEGKEYVSDQQKKAYVSGYVQLLIKTIHLVDDKDDTSLIEDIADDISTYLE